jgi:pimeloyl-ACP methyl ester carboxylesterase
VLAASVPPKGAHPFLLRWTKQRPMGIARSLFTGNSLALLNTPELCRDKLFSPQTPEADVVRCIARLQNESRLTSLGMCFQRPRPERVSTPMLVLGAADDNAFTQEEVHATARSYRTEATIFPGIGHDFMLEPGWQTVAEHVDNWLTDRGL